MNLLKKPKKYLISSYFEKEILINTEMAEFYLNLGLKITRIYEFIQFHPQKCFEKLANEIVNSRREADLDKSKTVIALTNKLTGNSLYSASLLNKDKHRNLPLQRHRQQSNQRPTFYSPRRNRFQCLRGKKFKTQHTPRFTNTNWFKRLFKFKTAYVEIFLLFFKKIHT